MEQISRELLEEKFDRLHEKLDMIHDQTKTMNGRVTCLEKWRNTADGAIKVLCVLVIPVLIYVIQEWIK